MHPASPTSMAAGDVGQTMCVHTCTFTRTHTHMHPRPLSEATLGSALLRWEMGAEHGVSRCWAPPAKRGGRKEWRWWQEGDRMGVEG